MSRNLNDSQSADYNVPIGGTVFRGSGNPNLITTSDGRVYLSPAQTAALSITEYPKFIETLSLYDSISNNTILTQSGFASVGELKTSFTSFGAISNNAQAGVYNSPIVFSGDSLFGQTATLGNYVLGQQRLPGGSNTSVPSGIVFDTVNRTTQIISSASSIGSWYDTTTSTMRNIFFTSSTPRIATSSDGVAFTSAAITFSAGSFGTTAAAAFYTNSMTGTFLLPQNNIVFAGSRQSTGNTLWVSTDSGDSFTNITTNYTAATGTFTNPTVVNYDGTTLFIQTASVSPAYSTNNGTSFTLSTISGSTSVASDPINALCKTRGASSSQFMWIANPGSIPTSYFTNDGGATITTVTLPATGMVSAGSATVTSLAYSGGVWCYSYYDVNISGNGVWVAYSSNNGATWTGVRVATNITATGNNHYIFAIDGAFYLVTENGIYRSTNGSTWTTVFINSVSDVNIAFGIADYVFCGNVVIKKSNLSCLQITRALAHASSNAFTLPIKLKADLAVRVAADTSGLINWLDSATSDKIRWGAPLNDATSYTTAGFPYMRIR